MIPSYDDYLEAKEPLTFEEMTELHRQMIEEIGEDAKATELYNELVAAANNYSPIRAGWLFWPKEERAGYNDKRTVNHDGVIAHLDSLAGYLRSQGRSAAWRDTIGYQEDAKVNRKRAGDFGCYIVFINSINAR